MFTTQCFLDCLKQLGSNILMVDGSVDNQLAEIGSEPHIMSAYEAKNPRVRPPKRKPIPLADRIASATVFSDHHSCQNPGTACIRDRMPGISEAVASRTILLVCNIWIAPSPLPRRQAT
jgi:prepilin-type processing-associated H-X9-DG protein